MDFSRVSQEVSIVAVRSRGPGGQNVNKVSSAAQLFWNYRASLGLNEWEKNRIGEKLKNLINREGEVYLRADEFRDLERNKSRALQKLEDFLRGALHRPKKRVATRPTRASKERKLATKAKRSDVKKGRGKVSWD